MEKARRKRVNNSLEQLRSLLPYSSSLKRDMASMLEQTVEYINTMHTVLNEEKPACLSKIYDIYRKKMEEHSFCRKATTPKTTKRKISDSGGCSSVGDAQQTPVEKRLQSGFCIDETATSSGGIKTKHAKHNESYLHDKPTSDYQQTPNQQNWQQQHIFDTVCDMNDNYMHSFIGIPHPSDAPHGMSPFNYINIFGQSPLANQLVMCQKQAADQHSHFVPPFSKPSNGFGFGQDYSRSTLGFQSDGNPVNRWDDGPCSSQMHTAKSGRKAPNFDINSLVYCPDQTEPRPSYSWNQWQGQQNNISCGYPPRPKSGSAAQHLLAPIDMTVSPSNGSVNSSPQYMGINKILEKDVPPVSSASEDATAVFRTSSVSSMLNEVTGQTPCGAYGSTERKMSLLHGWVKSPPPEEVSTSSNSTAQQYVIPTSKSFCTDSNGDGDMGSQNFEEAAAVFTPSSNSTTSESLCDSTGFDLSQSNVTKDCRNIDHATSSTLATVHVKTEDCSITDEVSC